MRKSACAVGKKFGDWTVLRKMDKNPDKPRSTRDSWVWCRCVCGVERAVRLATLHYGSSTSCGCHRLEKTMATNRIRLTTHGMSDTRTYAVWHAMRGRCEYTAHQSYALYGGRGIAVCPQWSRFETFLRDMGHKPPGKSLDRIDNDGDYSPENCRWASTHEQARNRRGTKRILFNGERRCLSEWAEKLGLSYFLIHRRIIRAGWSPERAFSQPSRCRRTRKQQQTTERTTQ
jgi:hypothetical protein